MSAIRELRNKNDEVDFIKSNPSCIIFFGSKTCGHCRNITPFVRDLAARYPRVAFAHVEVSEIKVEDVEGVPAFVGYKSHTYFDTLEGANRNALEKLAHDLLY